MANQILHYSDVRGFLKLALINGSDRLPEARIRGIQHRTLGQTGRIFKIMQQICCIAVSQKYFFDIIWEYLHILRLLKYLLNLPSVMNSYQSQIFGLT